MKYNLLEWPAVPKSRQARKVIPARHSAKGKQQNAKILAPAEQAALAKNATARVVKFPNPENDDEDGSTTDVEELKKQVRRAMKVLEEGKQVLAFNLLKRIVDS